MNTKITSMNEKLKKNPNDKFKKYVVQLKIIEWLPIGRCLSTSHLLNCLTLGGEGCSSLGGFT
jgi:hypothetical protein